MKPSQEFIDAFCDSSSVVITCELCNTTIFGSLSPGMFEPGELEKLRTQALENPKKFVEDVSLDGIYFVRISNKQIIVNHSDECDSQLAKYEQWILNHRFKIARFLNNRGKTIMEDAKIDADLSRINEEKL